MVREARIYLGCCPNTGILSTKVATGHSFDLCWWSIPEQYIFSVFFNSVSAKVLFDTSIHGLNKQHEPCVTCVSYSVTIKHSSTFMFHQQMKHKYVGTSVMRTASIIYCIDIPITLMALLKICELLIFV